MEAKTARPAAHIKLRSQSELIELLHRREEARLLFWDLQDKIQERLNQVPGIVQEAFLATEKLYALRLPNPPRSGAEPTEVRDRGIELLDSLVSKEKKEKTPAQKAKNKKKLEKLKEKQKKGKEEKRLKKMENLENQNLGTKRKEPGDQEESEQAGKIQKTM